MAKKMPKIISVSVAVSPDPESPWRLFVAVCEDGSVWQREIVTDTVLEGGSAYHYETRLTEWEKLEN